MKALMSRKFVLALLTLLSAHLLTKGAYIHEGVYSAVIIATIGAYIVGNVTQKQIQKDTPDPTLTP